MPTWNRTKVLVQWRKLHVHSLNHWAWLYWCKSSAYDYFKLGDRRAGFLPSVKSGKKRYVEVNVMDSFCRTTSPHISQVSSEDITFEVPWDSPKCSISWWIEVRSKAMAKSSYVGGSWKLLFHRFSNSGRDREPIQLPLGQKLLHSTYQSCQDSFYAVSKRKSCRQMAIHLPRHSGQISKHVTYHGLSYQFTWKCDEGGCVPHPGVLTLAPTYKIYEYLPVSIKFTSITLTI